MRKITAILGMVTLSVTIYAQGYTENWRAITAPGQPDETIRWHKVATTSANEVVAFGTAIVGPPPPAAHGPAADQTETVLIAKFDSAGTLLWITRDFTAPEPDVEPRDLGVDGAGNAYVSYLASSGIAHVACFASNDGALRWRKVSNVHPTSASTPIAVRSAGNSTFVYAGLGIDLGGAPAVNLLRLNAANGSTTSTLNIAGTTKAFLSSLRTDQNGNVIVSGQLDDDGFVRKLNQSFTQVWNTSFANTKAVSASFNESSNSVLAISRTNGFGTTKIFSLSGTNGSTLAQREFFQDEGFFEVVPSISGAWVGKWSLSFDGSNGIMGLTSSLQSYFLTLIPKIAFDLAADSSGAAHVPSVKSGSGPVFIVRRAPSTGIFEPAIGVSQADKVATDSLGRVITAGALLDGSAIIFQLDQQFLANTDVIVRDFTGTLNVEAPGVLANDTNWVGGTLSVTTPPAEGSVTLNADGSFSYTPNGSFDGTDQFQYRITKNGVPRTATCVVKQLVFTQLTAPTTVVGGDSFSATASVNNAGFIGVIRPSISISSNLATVNGSPILIQGETLVGINFKSKEVTANSNVTIGVTSSGQTRSAVVTLLPGGFKDVQTVGGAPILAGQPSTLVLRLTGPAQADRPIGLVYEGLNGPSAVTIPAGASSSSFSVTPTVGAGVTAKIRIFLASGLREFPFVIQAKPKLQDFILENGLLYAGTSFRVQAILDGQAGTSTIPVSVSSNSNQVTLPASANVQPAKSSAFANGVCNLAAANTTIIFTASLDGTTKSFAILARKNLLESFTLSTNTIPVQGSATGSVFLNWVAPPGGQTVGISVDQPLLLTVPTKLIIGAGQTSGTFPIQANRKAGTVTISVTIGQKKLTRTLTITP